MWPTPATWWPGTAAGRGSAAAWSECWQRRLGFRAMQFNLVVSTNSAGLRCWQRNGFHIVGTLPGAFRHQRLGYVDALVLFQDMMEGPGP